MIDEKVRPHSEVVDKMENKIKAVIQQYNNRMIDNKLVAQ
jgi:hypothetical protein